MAWFTWLIGHLAQINQVAQFVVLMIGLITGVYALRAARRALK